MTYFSTEYAAEQFLKAEISMNNHYEMVTSPFSQSFCTDIRMPSFA